MADVGNNKFSSVLMVTAFLVIGAVFYWLSVVTEPTDLAEAEEEEPVEVLTTGEFGQDPLEYEGQLVELSHVEVSESLGTHAFFFDLPNDDESYLVRLHPDVVQAGVQVLPGDSGPVGGRVEILSDSVLEIWEAEQILTEEQQERAAEVESFLYADDIAVTGGDAEEAAEPEEN